MQQGWIKAHRSMLHHPALQNDATFRVWMWFLMLASHKPCKLHWRGQDIGLHAGQLAISVRHFADEYGFTYKAVRHAMDRLIRDRCITVMQIRGAVLGAGRGAGRGAIGSIITICNWGEYQGEAEQRGAEFAQNGAQLGRTRGAQNKNGENLEEERKEKTKGTPNGVTPDLDADLFRLGSELLGDKPGRQAVASAKKVLGFGKACKLFQEARSKAEPSEYIWAAIHSHKRRAEVDPCKA